VAEDKSKDSKKDSKEKKPKSSMRDSAAKSRAKAEKPKRVRKAAGAAKKPVSKVGEVLTKDFHVVKPKSDDKFLTKSRKITPSYFRRAWAEVKLVTWPGRKMTWKLVFAVFVFSIVLGLYIAILDYGLEKLLREVIL
jgi:preprotein translocase SecE subunit